MREVISIHVGQAGVQLGNSCWELFCLEHGIQPDGSINQKMQEEEKANLGKIVSELEQDKYMPRSLFVDLEPTVVDEVRAGPYREFFHPDLLLSGKQDAAGCYACGYYSIGKDMIDLCMDRIRCLASICSGLEGFMIFSSIGGNTGSGFTSLMLEQLAEYYPKKCKMTFAIHPSNKLGTSVVEPYNAVLATEVLLKNSDVTVFLDNESLYEICKTKLNLSKPSYLNINRIISQMVSSTTASLRFDGALNVNISDFLTNLVPYPKINFLISSYAPLLAADLTFKEQISVSDITQPLFTKDTTLVKCNPKHGKYMGCCIMYRGDVMPKEVCTALSEVKNNRDISFLSWCKTQFKCGINYQPPATVPGGDLAKMQRSSCMLSNCTAIGEVLAANDHKFDLLYSKKGFVFWYIREGMEMDQFVEAREIVSCIEKNLEPGLVEVAEGENDEEEELE